jgi:putative addiction module component (TIGR02574 family)
MTMGAGAVPIVRTLLPNQGGERIKAEERMSGTTLDLDRLSPEEQLDLLDKLWERLSQTPSLLPVGEAQRRELDERLDALDADIGAGRTLGIPWDDVLRRIGTDR